MRRLLARVDRLAFAQRVALVLGIEAALMAIAVAATWPASYLPGGWFGYAPNTHVVFDDPPRPVMWDRWDVWLSRPVALAVWLVLIALGTAIAVRLLRPGGGE